MSNSAPTTYTEQVLAALGRSPEAIRQLLSANRFDGSFAAALGTGLVMGILEGISLLLQPWRGYLWRNDPLPPDFWPPSPDYRIYYLQQILIGNVIGVLLQWLLLTLAAVILTSMFFRKNAAERATDLYKVSGFALVPLAAVPAIKLLVSFQYASTPLTALITFTANILVVFYVIGLWILIIRGTYKFEHGEEFLLALPATLYYLLGLLPSSLPVPLPVPLIGTLESGLRNPLQGTGAEPYPVAFELILLMAVIAMSVILLNYLTRRSKTPQSKKQVS